MIITIERISDNKLEKKEWTFWLRDDNVGFQLFLDEYIETKRETTRHKFRRTLKMPKYHRLMRRESNMESSDVVIPEDVIQEAKDLIITRVRGTHLTL